MEVLETVDRERLAELHERDEFFWLDLTEPTAEDLKSVGEVLGLHPVALEDTIEFGQRPKLDQYGDHVLFVYYTARRAPGVGGGAGRAGRDPHLHLGLVRGDRAPLDLHRARRAAPGARHRGPEGRALHRLPHLRRPHRRLLSHHRGARGAHRRDRGAGAARPSPARSSWPRSTASSRTCRSSTGASCPSATTSSPARRRSSICPASRAGRRSTCATSATTWRRSPASCIVSRRTSTALTATYFNANANRLNAIATRLTIGGTFFLAWTLVTGFFGQNFGWLVDNVDTQARLPALRRRRPRRPHAGDRRRLLGQAQGLVLRAYPRRFPRIRSGCGDRYEAGGAAGGGTGRAPGHDGRVGDPRGAPGRAARGLPARGDGGPGARRLRGHRPRDGGGRELQQRLGRARPARLGLPLPRRGPPHRRLRRLRHRLEGRRGRHALGARRRGRPPLQPGLLRGSRGPRPRPAGGAVPADLGLRDHLGLLRPVLQGPGAAAAAQAQAPVMGGGRLLRPHLLHRLPDADGPGRAAVRPPRARVGRGRRARRLRAPAGQARRGRGRRRRLLRGEGRALQQARRLRASSTATSTRG